MADFRPNPTIIPASYYQELVSGIDLGPTALSLVGIPLPNYFEGRNIFDFQSKPREYVISTRDRCDFTIDRIRAVRSQDFKYIRNCMVDRPFKQITYMDVDEVEFMGVMRNLGATNKLDAVQSQFFADIRPGEELYDLKSDPYEINNLAEEVNYADTLAKFAQILDTWINETDDQGQYAEDEEGLKYMLGIWGVHATNVEYEPVKRRFPDVSGSLSSLKSAGWQKVGKH